MEGNERYVVTPSDQALRKGTSRLRPRANIIRMLGDELISNDAVAVTELIKNAYDADATHVRLRFSGDIGGGEGSIEVLDDGTGMSLDTVLSTWLEPASSTKRQQRKSALGRRMLGEKGIGRFAAARLSDTAEMITRENATESEIVVTFEWDAFKRSGYLDEIECDWEERRPLIFVTGSGTMLRLLKINRTWSEKDIEDLRDSLSRVISPFETFNDFSIVLDLPVGYEDIAGPIRPSELLRSPHYSIGGHVFDDGFYELHYSGKAGEEEKLTGDLNRLAPPTSGPFEIELRVWDRDPQGIRTIADVFDLRATDVRRELDRQTGIYVYRDGFRVLPYGEPNNDWLRLDMRRVQNPTLRVSNNQVVGCIVISADSNPGLIDQTNREGIVNSTAFDDLKNSVMYVLAQLEQRRYIERRRDAPPRIVRRGLFADFNLDPVRDAVRENYPEDKALLQAVVRHERDLSQRTTAVQEALARYRRLATLGELVDIFLHDGRTPLNQINSEADIAIRRLNRSGQPGAVIEPLVKRFDFIRQRGRFLAELFRKIEPFGGRRRGRPIPVSLESVVNSAFDLRQGKIDHLGVVCELPSTETIVTVDAVEMQQVIFNLLDNSLYWFEHQGEEDEKRIKIEISRSGSGEVEIVYSDSGPGVPEELREHIFSPYFSMKPDGIGLGLSIAGEVVAEYDGALELIDGPLPGASFRVTLRRRIG